MPGRPLTRNRRREANRDRHHEQRTAQAAVLGSKGIALAWSEQARGVARRRAMQGDPGGWQALAATLKWFCAGQPVDLEDLRAARRLYHWEERLAGLADADPKTLASAWWDRARSLAASQPGDDGWNTLGLALSNLAGSPEYTGLADHGQ